MDLTYLVKQFGPKKSILVKAAAILRTSFYEDSRFASKKLWLERKNNSGRQSGMYALNIKETFYENLESQLTLKKLFEWSMLRKKQQLY